MKNVNNWYLTDKERYNANYWDYTYTALIGFYNRFLIDIGNNLLFILRGLAGALSILILIAVFLTFPIFVFILGAIHMYNNKKRLIKKYPEFISVRRPLGKVG